MCDAILNGTGESLRIHLQGWRSRLYGDQAVRRRAAQSTTPHAGDGQRLGARGIVPGIRREKPCAVCNGARLKPEALAVRVGGKHIADASELSIRAAAAWFATVIDTLTPQRQEIARRILREIGERLQFLVDVGSTT